MRKVMRLDFAEQGQFNGTISDVRFFLIGELAKLLDVSPKTIRFYEEEGLISPERYGKYKVYKPLDAHRLQAILKFRKFGLTISGIREIFSNSLVDSNFSKQHDFASSVLKIQLDVLKKEKESLELVIGDLTRLLDE